MVPTLVWWPQTNSNNLHAMLAHFHTRHLYKIYPKVYAGKAKGHYGSQKPTQQCAGLYQRWYQPPVQTTLPGLRAALKRLHNARTSQTKHTQLVTTYSTNVGRSQQRATCEVEQRHATSCTTRRLVMTPRIAGPALSVSLTARREEGGFLK